MKFIHSQHVKNIAKSFTIARIVDVKAFTRTTLVYSLNITSKLKKKSIKDSPCLLAPHAPLLNHYTNTHTSEKLWFLFKTMDTHKVHN
jgi:hypothetical protein